MIMQTIVLWSMLEIIIIMVQHRWLEFFLTNNKIIPNTPDSWILSVVKNAFLTTTSVTPILSTAKYKATIFLSGDILNSSVFSWGHFWRRQFGVKFCVTQYSPSLSSVWKSLSLSLTLFLSHTRAHNGRDRVLIPYLLTLSFSPSHSFFL